MAQVSHFYNKHSTEFFQNLWFPPDPGIFSQKFCLFNGFHQNSPIHSYFYNDFTHKIIADQKIINNCNQILYDNVINDIKQLKNNNNKINNISKKTGIRVHEEGVSIKCRKIRIFPNKDYLQIFNDCFGISRYIYNLCVDFFYKQVNDIKRQYKRLAKKKGCLHLLPVKRTKQKTKQGSKTGKRKPIVIKKIDDKSIKRCCGKLHNSYFCEEHLNSKLKYNIPTKLDHWRDNIVIKNKNLTEDNNWLAKAPYDTRQLAVKNFLSGMKSIFTNLAKGNIKKFKIKFKSKKKENPFFCIDHRSLKPNLVLFPYKCKKILRISKRDRRWLKNYLQNNKVCDMIISRESPGNYYLQVPYNIEKSDIQTVDSIVSIDPGVKSLGTYYSPTGNCGKMSERLDERIYQLYLKADKLRSQICLEADSLNNYKRIDNKIIEIKKSKKRIKRLKKRLKLMTRKKLNVTKDCHDKAISYYTKNYNYIVIPEFNSKQIAKKQKRMGMRKEARKTMGMCHGKFMERLKIKVNSINNCSIIIVEEDYTSKTCGRCGKIHQELRNKRKFKCPSCGFYQDRDMNAARNILIRGLIRDKY